MEHMFPNTRITRKAIQAEWRSWGEPRKVAETGDRGTGAGFQLLLLVRLKTAWQTSAHSEGQAWVHSGCAGSPTSLGFQLKKQYSSHLNLLCQNHLQIIPKDCGGQQRKNTSNWFWNLTFIFTTLEGIGKFILTFWKTSSFYFNLII